MIIVSCAEKVPYLISKYDPDCVLSIASRLVVPKGICHQFLNFSDIDSPSQGNISFAATKEHIESIRSIQYETIIIHCRQGQRRSPAAAIILGGGDNPQQYFDDMKSKAPYIQPNPWMLKLAGISLTDKTPRMIPPAGCYFVMQ